MTKTTKLIAKRTHMHHDDIYPNVVVVVVVVVVK